MADESLVEALIEPLHAARREYEGAQETVTQIADGLEQIISSVFEETKAAVICTVCNKVLSPGTMPPSHGLCEDCMPKFMRG